MLRLLVRSAVRLSFLSIASVRSLSTNPKVVWFRDFALRLQDNEAIKFAVNEAASSKNFILPIFLIQPHNRRTGGTARDVFTVDALKSINKSMLGTLKIGSINSDSSYDTAAALIHACKATDAKEIYYLKSLDNDFESNLEKVLKDNDIIPRGFGGSTTLLNYTVQSIPWKEIIFNDPWRSPLIPYVDFVIKTLEEEPIYVTSTPLELESVLQTDVSPENLFLHPVSVDFLSDGVGKSSGGTNWGERILSNWPASEEKAVDNLHTFLEALQNNEGESKVTHLASYLSPYLARGLLSPKRVYHHIQSVKDQVNVNSIIRRICWRDYTMGVCMLFPQVTKGRSIRSGYEYLENGLESICMEEKAIRLNAWKKGMTGFPLIDAGMRQLDAEGWMPQKTRLACAAFLVEGLGLSWRDGMHHFEEYLVDFDVAINSNMWQNAGLVGFDPYYVGMNFKRRGYWDQDGHYVRRWVPELKALPDFMDIPCKTGLVKVDCLYEPWKAPEITLLENGVVLGDTYPQRICDDRKTRTEFFEIARTIRQSWSVGCIDERKRDLVQIGSSNNDRIGMFTPRSIQFPRMKAIDSS